MAWSLEGGGPGAEAEGAISAQLYSGRPFRRIAPPHLGPRAGKAMSRDGGGKGDEVVPLGGSEGRRTILVEDEEGVVLVVEVGAGDTGFLLREVSLDRGPGEPALEQRGQ